MDTPSYPWIGDMTSFKDIYAYEIDESSSDMAITPMQSGGSPFFEEVDLYRHPKPSLSIAATGHPYTSLENWAPKPEFQPERPFVRVLIPSGTAKDVAGALLIGNNAMAGNTNSLYGFCVTCVIDCGNNSKIPQTEPMWNGYRPLRFPIIVPESEDALFQFDWHGAVKTIHTALKSRHTVLLTSEPGSHSALCLATAYMTLQEGIKLEDAFSYFASMDLHIGLSHSHIRALSSMKSRIMQLKDQLNPVKVMETQNPTKSPFSESYSSNSTESTAPPTPIDTEDDFTSSNGGNSSIECPMIECSEKPKKAPFSESAPSNANSFPSTTSLANFKIKSPRRKRPSHSAPNKRPRRVAKASTESYLILNIPIMTPKQKRTSPLKKPSTQCISTEAEASSSSSSSSSSPSSFSRAITHPTSSPSYSWAASHAAPAYYQLRDEIRSNLSLSHRSPLLGRFLSPRSQFPWVPATLGMKITQENWLQRSDSSS